MKKSKKSQLVNLITTNNWKVCNNWNGNPLQKDDMCHSSVYEPTGMEVIFKISRLPGKRITLYPNPKHTATVLEIAKQIGADIGPDLHEGQRRIREYNPEGPGENLGGFPGGSLYVLLFVLFIVIIFTFFKP